MAGRDGAASQSLLMPTNNVQWMQIQKDTFTNWVNEQLTPKGLSIRDLRTDFSNGVLLVTLVETLKRQQLTGTELHPSNNYQKLQNITVSLDAIADDNVRIINIDSKEILEGNSKLILALVWQLILRYQIGLSNIQHRNWMLAWIQAVIPDCNIKNFTSDWNDGTALFALLDFCIPGHNSNWRLMDRSDRENNCRLAMKKAKQQFGIPLILRPEHLASRELDEMSAITYLSYFMKVGSPGYNATLQHIQPLVRNVPVFNFTTDWNNGRVLCELVTNFGISLPNWPEGNVSSIELLQQGIDGGLKLNVDPILTAADMAEEEKEHLGIMAYAARFIHLLPVPGATLVAKRQEEVVLWERDRNVRHRESSLKERQFVTNSRQSANLGNGELPKVVSVHHNTDSRYTVSGPPAQNRDKQLYSLMNADSTDGRPTRSFDFVRTPSIRKARRKHHEVVSQPPPEEEVQIDTFCTGVILKEKHPSVYSKDAVRLEAESPTGRIVRVSGDGRYNAQFGKDEIGKWKISMYVNEKRVNSCPIDICDPSQVKVTGLKPGVIGKPLKFKIDCRSAGNGEVEVNVTHISGRIPCYFTEPSPNVYMANFTPFQGGIYHIGICFNKAEIQSVESKNDKSENENNRRIDFETTITEEENHTYIKSMCDWQIDYVTGGPFEIQVNDTVDIKVYSMLDGTVCNTPHLIADCTEHPHGRLDAEVVYNTIRFPAEVTEEKPDVYRINFRPRGPGVYKVWVLFDGVVVKGSPFIQEIEEVVSPSAIGDGLVKAEEEKDAKFRVDARGFPGELSVQVNGPNFPVSSKIRPESDGTYSVKYVPQEVGWHRVHVKMDGKDIDKSPFKVRVINPSKVRVSGGLRPLLDDKERIPLVVSKEKQIPFDASEAGPGELNAEVHGPSSTIPVTVDSRAGSKHILVFTPKEQGKHYIDVRWSAVPLMGSPFLGYATGDLPADKPSYNSVILLHNSDDSGSSSSDDSNIDRPRNKSLKRLVKKNPSLSSNGSYKPKVYLNRHISDASTGSSVKRRHKPQHQNSLRSSTTVSDGDSIKGPRISAVYVPTRSPSDSSSTPPRDQGPSPKVILSGPGLKQASIGRPTTFMIDGRKAPPGSPSVSISSVLVPNLPAEIQQTGPQKYKCTYKPAVPGAYLLDISWNKQPLKCCPLKVNVHSKPVSTSDPSRRPNSPRSTTSTLPPKKAGNKPSLLSSNKMKDAIVGRPIQFTLDPKAFGHGELRVDCVGPRGEHVPVYSDPHPDGTVGVQLRPIGPGRHILSVRFNDRHIFDSPYAIDVKLNNTSGKIDVYGPGIDNGILPYFEGQFWVDAREAGAGELHVSIMGPKGAFRVEMHRTSQKTRLFHCRYNPVEPGVYTVNVYWSGVHVKSSPYIVLLATSEYELDRMIIDRRESMIPMPGSSKPSSVITEPLMY